jgi:aryl-alcohol dehydrogenase-like predicted oxidoreductase
VQYKTFGRRTGLRVSELALGTANFGTGWGHGAERDEAKRVFDGYVEAGRNFIDTADRYQVDQSETLVGEFIAADRDHFVLATKYPLGAVPNGGISRTGNSRKNMVRSVEQSLNRLKTDRIALYWAHFANGVTPIKEILRAFDRTPTRSLQAGCRPSRKAVGAASGTPISCRNLATLSSRNIGPRAALRIPISISG